MTEKRLFSVSAKLTDEINSFIHHYADMNQITVSEIIFNHFCDLQKKEKARYLQLKALFDKETGKPDKTE